MRAGDATRTWIGFAAPRSHGYPPTQSAETRSVATGLAVVSVSQPTRSGTRGPNTNNLWVIAAVPGLTKRHSQARFGKSGHWYARVSGCSVPVARGGAIRSTLHEPQMSKRWAGVLTRWSTIKADRQLKVNALEQAG